MEESSDNITLIVADGEFPVHEIPLGYLKKAERIICCDGSAEDLIKTGYIPDAIVGDMDSLNATIASRFNDRIHRDSDQETNDLTKAVSWCVASGYNNLVIVGATGKREDHTLGNISLLAEYVKRVSVRMITDTGILMALTASAVIPSFPGQQVSIFSLNPETEITSYRLKYPLEKKKLTNWWMATLNEAITDSFGLDFNNGSVIVYLKFRD